MAIIFFNNYFLFIFSSEKTGKQEQILYYPLSSSEIKVRKRNVFEDEKSQQTRWLNCLKQRKLFLKSEDSVTAGYPVQTPRPYGYLS